MISLIAVVAAFSLITVLVTKSAAEGQVPEETASSEISAPEPAAEAEETGSLAEDAADGENTDAEKSGTADMKAAAEALIGEQVTMEDIEEKVGKYEDFQMDSNGCERGVFAGLFYYKGFTIRSRTYDRGKTFTIVEVG